MPTKANFVQVAWLGSVPYPRAERLQRQLAGSIAAGLSPPTVLLLEHPHTYTMGRSGKWEHLLWDEFQLRKMEIKVFETERGGDITYHGPGQLVAYPLLPLGPVNAAGRLSGPDYHGYLRRLERVMIQALQPWGLTVAAMEGLTGVWVTGQTTLGKPAVVPAKIGSIGVKIDASGVSRHGFSLNLNPDMTYFRGIVPCGISQHPVTSLANCLDDPPSMDQLRDQVLVAFREIFDCRLKMVEGDTITAMGQV